MHLFSQRATKKSQIFTFVLSSTDHYHPCSITDILQGKCVHLNCHKYTRFYKMMGENITKRKIHTESKTSEIWSL